MAKVKDILIHVAVETAKRPRKCHHNKKHVISAGSVCMVVKDGMYKRNYCVACTKEMLDQAKDRFTSIRRRFGMSAAS